MLKYHDPSDAVLEIFDDWGTGSVLEWL